MKAADYKKGIARKFASLCLHLDHPKTGWVKNADDKSRAIIGALFITHNTHSGWSIGKYTGHGGGEYTIEHGLSHAEMYYYLTGVVSALLHRDTFKTLDPQATINAKES